MQLIKEGISPEHGELERFTCIPNDPYQNPIKIKKWNEDNKIGRRFPFETKLKRMGEKNNNDGFEFLKLGGQMEFQEQM